MEVKWYKMKLSKYIDHTFLKQDANSNDIKKLCEEAMNYDFMAVCINPWFIPLAKKLLVGSDVLVCTVIGFPLGQNTTETKVFETQEAIKDGADEIDMVINVSKLKENDRKYCINEINEIKKSAGNKILKVIVETCLLTSEEVKRAMEFVNDSNADFIKTSTGFSTAGADIKDIIIWSKMVKNGKKIKAAGGIRSHEDLLLFIKEGASRIGASSGIKLIIESSVINSKEY